MDKTALISLLVQRGAPTKQAHNLTVYLLAIEQVRAFDGDYAAMIDAVCALNHWTGAA